MLARTGKVENLGVVLGFSPKTRVLGIKPVPYHLKPPQTYRLFPSGVRKNVFLVSFDRQARAWGIPQDGRVVPCVWDDKNSMLLLFVDKVRKESDAKKPSQRT
jgi:hypothetical protein